ncbi:heavy metal translocating P-type ATPase [Latilactobacillus curvatus]|uniref:heavy metal translocating P-type ATPase n=1 Tax=Latilactobacillus curvatus TaxID=28038 RepID=UPI0020C7EA58|nr:heavy metal translocating P-type ATPase [Latilactobacillus curvatus]MCP8847261.1 heavy metal translocating P-type ATPase [Latilactobacillus curvatus]MCP8865617.1 heavy metal translocating P-type ATPase [Latilactobacillus curvatus]MCP8874493.1 heavy metal translocating P-type ATPase [Latilactobacillus curvatus]MCP8876293.1 heavy metal translocating P-type ATPase [Latilactobacillus curvatus]MCP8879883.1 heavy metal translocating P-type ATPase [Latilactobacillus curvatus]
MKFQRWLQSVKNQIALTVGGLIAVAYGWYWLGGAVIVMQGLLLVASMMGVAPILMQAYQALKVKVISIDLLVTIAVLGALIIGEFNESAIVTFLFLFGSYLEQRTLKKTRESIRALSEMAPQTAQVLAADGTTTTVDVDDVEIDDQVLVKAGAQVPVDGQVVQGSAYVNEASITGEAQLVKKIVGDAVYSGAIVDNGTLTVTATQVGDDTTFAQIIELVEEAQDSKSPAEKFIDRFATYYTPAVLVLALAIGLITRDFKLAITILVLGCPGALVIGAPVSIVAGIGNGAKHGVLIKGGEVVNAMAGIDTMVFDKTGTLTKGDTAVAHVQFYTAAEQATLAVTTAVEAQSDHPLATAIVQYAREQGVTDLPTIERIETLKGLGVQAEVAGQTIRIGRAKMMTEAGIRLTGAQIAAITASQTAGQSTVLVAVDQQVVLLIGIADTVKPEAKAALTRLKKAGVKHLVMLTGDNDQTAAAIAKAVGITEYHANLLPAEKVEFIKTYQANGQKVAFIGDGINDSPSLALADIGIAMGSGTDVAIETSDIVLMQSTLSELVYADYLTKATARNTVQNIVIAVGTVGLLLLGLMLGWVQMASGMFVHEISILVVIFNAMRLIRFKVR